MPHKITRWACDVCETIYTDRATAAACEDRVNEQHVLQVGDVFADNDYLYKVTRLMWEPEVGSVRHIAKYAYFPWRRREHENAPWEDVHPGLQDAFTMLQKAAVQALPNILTSEAVMNI